MALGSFMSLLPYAFAHNQHDGYYLQAVSAGQEYLDSLRDAVEKNRPLPAAPVVPIEGGGSVVDYTTIEQSPGNFSITGACTQSLPLSDLRYCSVTVQWTEHGQSRSYFVESYATQQVS